MLHPRSNGGDSWFTASRYAGQRKIAGVCVFVVIVLFVVTRGGGDGANGYSSGAGGAGSTTWGGATGGGSSGRSTSGAGGDSDKPHPVSNEGVLSAHEKVVKASANYDPTYPLSGFKAGSSTFLFGVITDMDKASKVDGKTNLWKSTLKIGRLIRSSSGEYDVAWVAQTAIKSSLAVGGRSMELSALVTYNGKLWTCDDRTGVVYELEPVDGKMEFTYSAVPRFILAEGDGETSKNLKCEWMSVKDGHLFVGGFGKEFVSDKDGSITSEGPMWVKVIDPEGRIEHVDWRPNYRVLRKVTGTEHPAYLLHEAVMWHEPHGRWYFLPRRVSTDPYDEVKDERRGSNMIISVPSTFEAADVKVMRAGPIVPSHGFSAVRFVPGFPNELVALKSVEDAGITETYIMVIDVSTGEVLMDETKFGEFKFEGLEFL